MLVNRRDKNAADDAEKSTVVAAIVAAVWIWVPIMTKSELAGIMIML